MPLSQHNMQWKEDAAIFQLNVKLTKCNETNIFLPGE
jgi:hypothetical protein